MTTTSPAQRAAFAILGLSVALVLALAATLLVYSVPMADDFCRAAVPDLIAHLHNIYFYWSGRWFSIGLGIEILSHIGLTEHYPALMALLFLTTWSGWVLFAACLVGRTTPVSGLLAIGTLLFALYWTGAPQPGETTYWASGSLENHLGPFLAVLSLSLMACYTAARPGPMRLLLLAAAGVTAFLCTGIHEVTALALGLVSIVACVAAFRTGQRDRYAWLALTAIVIVGALIVIGAPGNFNRARFFPDGGNVLRSLKMLAWGSMTQFLPWVLDVKLLALSVLFLSLPAFNGRVPAWLSDGRMPWRWGIPLATVGLVHAIFLATGWGTGSIGPARLHDQMYILFLAGWLLTLLAWADRLAPFFQPATAISARGPVLPAVAALLLAGGLLSATNSMNAVSDLGRDARHNIAAWHAAVEARYPAIAEAKAAGRTKVTLPAPPLHPLSFPETDLTPVAGDPRNSCTARYFKLKELAVSRGGG